MRVLQGCFKQHNKYYRKIDIDLAALNQLPEDGNLTGLCKAVTETNVDEEELKPKECDQRKKPVQEQHTVAWPPAGYQ